MSIKNTYTGASGVTYLMEYFDADSFENLPLELCKQAYAVCFCGDKMVIGYGGAKKAWGLIGGSVEKGESLEQTLVREVREESNMKVLASRPVGYQIVTDTRDASNSYQVRYVCIVEPYGPFVVDAADGDKGITEIALIDPKEYRKYFDWGAIGERIIQRAIELRNELL